MVNRYFDRMIFIDEEPSNVAFGSTGDREIFPSHVPHTRFGNDLNPITGAPNRGPGHYEVEEETNFVNEFNRRPLSKKGYTLGARTATRFRDYIDLVTPDPAAYQPDRTKELDFCQAYRPFNSGTSRAKGSQTEKCDALPGPGMYDCRLPPTRKVTYHQSFGGNPINLPDVTQHSTIDNNTDKLRSTKEEKLYHRRLAYLKLYYD